MNIELERKIGKIITNEEFPEHSDDFNYVLDGWNYSLLKSYLGENGFVSMSVEREDVEIKTETERLITKAETAIDSYLDAIIRKDEKLNHWASGTRLDKDGSSLKLKLTYRGEDPSVVVERKTVRKTIEGYLKQPFIQKALRNSKGDSDIEDRRKLMEERLSKAEISLSRVVPKQKGTLYISALPKDLLTMSINLNGWRSCVAPGGDYSITSGNWIRSEAVMVAYFVPDNSSKKDISYVDYESKAEYKVHNKYWRVLIFTTSDDGIGISSQYPYRDKGLKSEVVNYFKQFFKKPVVIDDITSNYDGPGYFDGISTLVSEEELTEEDPYVSIDVPSTCIECGDWIESNDINTLRCYECSGAHWCDECGEYHLDDEVYEAFGERGRTYSICEGSTYEYEWCHLRDKYYSPYDFDETTLVYNGYGLSVADTGLEDYTEVIVYAVDAIDHEDEGYTELITENEVYRFYTDNPTGLLDNSSYDFKLVMREGFLESGLLASINNGDQCLVSRGLLEELDEDNDERHEFIPVPAGVPVS